MKERKNEILACMKCGSANLNGNPGAEYLGYTAVGLSGAMSGEMLCNRCSYFGYPIEFSTEKARKVYEDSKAKTRGALAKKDAKTPAKKGNTKNPARMKTPGIKKGKK
ncbi:MAG TPA: hypothetical protein PLO51_01035 [Candidatus Micrarchaeota archaeon]|nr:hypothetical protein [Candidatus Micrarchaeota archaeon]